MSDNYASIVGNQYIAAPSAPDRETTEIRPLERIASFADEINQLGAELAQYLERFNGPRPADLAGGKESARPPSTYRTEIERLQDMIANMRQIVNQISRLG